MRSRLVFLIPLAMALTSLGLPASAEIRSLVPIVRPVYARDTISFLEKLSDSMKSDGYNDAAAVLKSYASGGFGSGFVYIAKDGSNYIVTNRHVVSQAETVTLEFENPDGSQAVYKGCSVVAVGEDIDLALVAMPNGTRPFSAGLEFSAIKPEDGIEVWTAGYPGLGDTPSWQLGKGNVTNSMAKIPVLIDPAITTLIQHSAQIDPGNSGGPLLIADKSVPAGYKVVGVNTWKAYDRQATNFSIPSAATATFIADALSRASDSSTWSKALESRCRGFIGAAAKPENAYKEMSKYISYAYVAREGEVVIKKVLSIAPTTVRNDIIDVFSNVSPIEGIRLAIAYDISSYIKKADAAGPEFVAIDGDAGSASAPVPVRFKLSGKDVSLTWAREHGVWRLTTFPLDTQKASEDKKQKPGTRGVSYDESPYRILLQTGPDISVGNSIHKSFWQISALVVPDTYVGYGFSVGWRNISIDPTDSGETNSTQLQVAGLIRAQLPIRTSSLNIVPYANFTGGLGLDEGVADYLGGTGFFSAVEGGANLSVEAIRFLYFGCAYKYYLSAPSDFKGSAFSIRLGLGFGE
jgi:serine protease Do